MDINPAVVRRTLSACHKRVQSWGTPPNWSSSSWSAEIHQVEDIAAFKASANFDRSKGIPLGAFIYQRVMASARTRSRQEWAFGLRFLPLLEGAATGALA